MLRVRDMWTQILEASFTGAEVQRSGDSLSQLVLPQQELVKAFRERQTPLLPTGDDQINLEELLNRTKEDRMSSIALMRRPKRPRPPPFQPNGR